MSADAKPVPASQVTAPQGSSADPLVGRRIGGYTVVRRVGQGGMGVVYEAKHERLEQRAAVKVLHKELSSDTKVLQRFFNEAKAISKAQHSGIVKIFDFGQLDDGIAYILMEFLDGEPLLVRLERMQEKQQSLPLSLIVELGRQTAAALALIHEKGIVHRDLKPENLFVVPDAIAPQGERIKLLDFGIAKFLDGPVRKTTVGMILGTPLYMAPEQCEGREDLDEKVDVYALGVLLYEMIVGHLPFVADTAAALMRQHMFRAPPPLDGEVPNLPPDLVTIVHQMLNKQPKERPAMRDIAVRLENILPIVGAQTGKAFSVRRPSSHFGLQATANGSEEAPDPFAATMGGVSANSHGRISGSMAPHASRTTDIKPVSTRRLAAILAIALLAFGSVAGGLYLRSMSQRQVQAQVAPPITPTPPTSPPPPVVAETKPAATLPATATPTATPPATKEDGPEDKPRTDKKPKGKQKKQHADDKRGVMETNRDDPAKSDKPKRNTPVEKWD